MWRVRDVTDRDVADVVFVRDDLRQLLRDEGRNGGALAGSEAETVRLKDASVELIYRCIDQVYCDSETKNKKPPNVREIGRAVRPLLNAAGLKASDNQIKKCAEDSRYGGRRWKQGQKPPQSAPPQ